MTGWFTAIILFFLFFIKMHGYILYKNERLRCKEENDKREGGMEKGENKIKKQG